ncbi:chromate efflux transporter [Nocardioides insulae]|uniref:chromate efflux transporter n=1 Tax=Nocardioides insulae TaxID=394734 RepID=UPI00048F245E|nr:chromate efflux transporter [Nocardioides insulae]
MNPPHEGIADLGAVLREWGRIGCLGFGGPPVHIRMLHEVCVQRRGWIDEVEFEDAVATCNLLPGPSSTQLAIFTAWRVRGRTGALLGGAAFILPGFVLILALSVLFLAGAPPTWVLGAGAGAGSAVAAVAVSAGWALLVPSWERRAHPARWIGYVVAGGVSAATIGPWLVLVLLGCGGVELVVRHPRSPHRPREVGGHYALVSPGLVAGLLGTAGSGVLLALSWTALKVGALSYGGGFVIIPLMQGDAVEQHGWMSDADFLNAVALGQITPGPVVLTVAVVGYAAAGLLGAVLATAVAFLPSFVLVLGGATHFDRWRNGPRIRAFLDGAGPAAIGAILGSALPLAVALAEPWQFAVLLGAAALLLVARRGVVLTLLLAAAVGVVVALAGGPLP